MQPKRFKQKAKYFSDKVIKSGNKFKKTIAVLCSAAIIATAVPIASIIGANAASVSIYASTTDYLNIRTGAGLNYSVIKVIPINQTVTFLDRSNPDWIKVKLSDGTIGYCSADYLDVITDAKTTDYLNFRTGPSTNYSVIKTISPGVTVDILRFAGSSWAQVKLSDGTKGYVCTDYISYIGTDNSNKTTTKNTIKLSLTQLSINMGTSTKLTATVSSGGTVKWSSSNTKVATVSADGIIKGISDGTAKITATDSKTNVSASCNVTVKNPNNNSITLSNSNISVNVGSSFKITAKASIASTNIKWSSSDLNVASVNEGVISGLKSGKAIITASDESGKIKQTCTVTVNGVSSYGISVSRASASITAGKTLYIKGYSSNSASWYSSDTSIATVSEGFVYAKKSGKVAISYKDSFGNTAVCIVTVYDAAPIKFAYSSPNSATLNSTVNLVAITDKSRSKVKFNVNIEGKTIEVNATSKIADGDTYVWKGSLKVTSAGTFDVKAYSYKNGEWKTCDDGLTDIYVSSKDNKNITSYDPLRASDELIKFIGEKEGFVSKITYDTLANNIPTLGHGYVVWEGQKFYDNITRNEGYALLVNAVNNDSYTSAVNNMLIKNNIKFNQQQFDALVSFSYNLGTGWTSSSDLKDILLNSIGISSNGDVLTGTVNTYSGLNLRSQPTTSSNVLTVLLYNEKVTILSSEKYNNVWYKVKTSSGQTGYCSSTYLNVSTTGKVERDLSYVNRNALIQEVLAYHHAGGNCYYGLLYRRADELEMFLYNDYATDGRDNNHNFPNPYCISFP